MPNHECTFCFKQARAEALVSSPQRNEPIRIRLCYPCRDVLRTLMMHNPAQLERWLSSLWEKSTNAR